MVSALPKAFPFLFLEPISPLHLFCVLFLADRLRDVFSSDIYTWPVEVLHSRADSEINDGQSGVSGNIRKRCKFLPNQAKGEEVGLVEDYLSYFKDYICQMTMVSHLQTHSIINLFKSCGYCVYHECWHSRILHSERSVVVCFCLSQNYSEFFSIQRSVIGFYNRDGTCLLRGTNCAFK